MEIELKKRRIIPVLLHRDGWLVQSIGFSEYKRLGNALKSVERLSSWDADECIYLDISEVGNYSINRIDTKNPQSKDLTELLNEVSKASRMPLTFGGGIRTLLDIEQRLRSGADKISINTIAMLEPDIITKAANEFGSQCIVVSVDYIEAQDSRKVFARDPRAAASPPKALNHWLKEIEDRGAGEILLNSASRDGMKTGYDLEFLNEITKVITIPIIASGGVGKFEDFEDALRDTGVDGAAAANIFHFQDQSNYSIRKLLYDKGFDVRKPSLAIRE